MRTARKILKRDTDMTTAAIFRLARNNHLLGPMAKIWAVEATISPLVAKASGSPPRKKNPASSQTQSETEISGLRRFNIEVG
jgi:hypothetical protein